MVHPQYSGRAVTKFYANRGLDRYAAITLKGKRTLITFISVYIAPSPSGECDQVATHQRYIDCHK